MNIPLIQGQYSSAEALDIITQMIHLKIKYHENKICSISNEVDIKNCEAKIKRLQKDLYEIRKHIKQNGNVINIKSEIEISKNV